MTNTNIIIKIIIDNREKELIHVIEKYKLENNANNKCNQNNCDKDKCEKECISTYISNISNDISYANLTLGDIIFVVNGDIFIYIERKTLHDLASSIIDGRYKDQKHRLMNCGTRFIYIIEGKFSHYNDKHSSINKSTIKSAIVNMIIRDNIQIIRSNNLIDTIHYITKIHNGIEKHYKTMCGINGVDTGVDSCVDKCDNINIKLFKKNKLTPHQCFINQLSQIPQLSIKGANEIASRFKSMRDLVLAFDDDVDKTVKLISDIKIGNKRIGNIIAQRIADFIQWG